ncbi:MAG: OmpA family protein [Bacteroidetes bacterium]|nr:OmpA family protein [Bacteroidota bacterium]
MKAKSTLNGWFLSVLAVSFWLSSCVPARQFEDMKKKEKDCQDENSKLKSDNQQLGTKNTELSAEVEDLQKRVSGLRKDTAETGNSIRRLTELYNELMKSYDKLLSNNEKLLAGNTAETKKLIAQLSQTREDLQKKEDQLKKDQKNIADTETRLEELKNSLKEREAKVAELQSILNKKDSAVAALKKAVTDALLGFENNGLTITQKNGKVYVSLEEQLLFASGSIIVEKKGEQALKQLAVVLDKNKDINVLVEGHTDDVPISGTLPSGAKDNWELSVLRATSVVKIITKNSTVAPNRLTAAGRGPFVPVETGSSPEVKRKNRRTEIILTPKLDELLKVLETN